MTFKEYQLEAWATALPTAKNVEYMTLGLANEAGEVAGKLKKKLRGDHANQLLWSREIAKEIGDVLWYCAGIATVLGLDLEWVAKANVEKLQDRQNRGKIQGDGDTR